LKETKPKEMMTYIIYGRKMKKGPC